MTRRTGVAVAGLLVVAVGGAVGMTVLGRTTAESSAVSALSRQVLDKLALYHKQHGHYPARLEDLALDLTAADGANEATLRFLRYTSDGSSFTYGETGPDEFHRRVWWCAAPTTCGFLDMR